MAWRTNFYYKQELKSEEMNGIFNSSLIPGIYNADIRISQADASSSKLFNVEISAGSTFIFSNRVAENNGRFYRQFADFSNVRGSSYYTIKSTTTVDTVEGVTSPGSGKTFPDRMFLVATMPYGESTLKVDPTFRLASVTSSGSPFLEEYPRTQDSPVFYDGLSSLETLVSPVAYLIVGEFIRVGGTISTNTSSAIDFGSFINSYVFTRRGLKEYRFGYSSDKDIPSVDFSYTQDLKSLKMRWAKFFTNSVLFNAEDDSYDEFIQISRSHDITIKADPELTSAQLNALPPVGGSTDKSGVIYDFIFAAFREVYQDGSDLSDLMTSTSYGNIPTLYSCKWVSGGGAFASPQKLPLSENPSLQDALLDRISGKPILSRVAAALKRGEVEMYSASGASVSPTPAIMSTLVPIALIQRPFTVDKDGKMTGSNKCKVGSTPQINPDFVISYLDIYQGATECNSLSMAATDIYSTAAILS